MKLTNIIYLGCIAAISLATLAGCAESTNDIPANMTGLSVPQAQPNEQDVMAIVDGEPIYMETLYNLLVHNGGMALAQELIANKVIDQEAARQGIEITDADIDAASQKTLSRMLPQATSRDQQERVLESMLAQRGISRKLWRLNMRRFATLAKLAEAQVTVTEEQLEAAFANIYGRGVQVRHIQTATPQEAQEVLNELENGVDFGELAKRVSKNPSARNGGMLPWIAANSPGIPPALATAAMALTEVGEISDPIQIGTTFHVLKLQDVRPAQEIDIESVREELTAKAHEVQVEQISRQILRDLLESAQMSGKIRLVNPILKAQKK